MAVTRGSKSWWIVHVAAGVAAVALLAFGMTQCSDKNVERAEKQAKQSELDYASRQLKTVVSWLDGQIQVNRVLNDRICMQRDSIAVLNDKLADCRKAKKPCSQPAQPVKKPVVSKPVKKPVASKPVEKPQPKPQPVVKPDTVVVVVQAPVDTAKCAPVVNVNLNNSRNNGAIVVGNNNNVVVNNVASDKAVADTLVRVTKIRRVIVNCEIQRTY